MAGDFILSVASMMIARLKNNDVTLILSQVSRNVTCILRVDDEAPLIPRGGNEKLSTLISSVLMTLTWYAFFTYIAW